MTKLISLLSVLALASCGDNIKVQNDAAPDSPTPIPAVPTLGTQMDRMGRPAVNTALNHAFDGTTGGGTAKDAYNVDGSPGGWPTAYAGAFAASLGLIDALDTGYTCPSDGTGACTGPSNAATAGAGCGNQVMYNGMLAGGGTPMATSYAILATVLADDELYLDTTKTSCDLPNHANYLAVEFSALSPVPNVTCGGRAPTNDVMDTSYTALAFGVNGFNLSDFTPFFGDGVGPHADENNDTFPFFGAPH